MVIRDNLHEESSRLRNSTYSFYDGFEVMLLLY